jgi:hypothetical protein
MKKLFLLTTIALIATTLQAKVWRVNNTPGIIADFNEVATCIANASVVNDDTIHVESSLTIYQPFWLTKKLVIIGTGYFLSGANSNTGLQANTNAGTINYVYIDTLGSGSKIIGINFSDGIYSNYNGTGQGSGQGADNITITRCRIPSAITLGYGSPLAGADYTGWVINKCIITTTTANTRPIKNGIYKQYFIRRNQH